MFDSIQKLCLKECTFVWKLLSVSKKQGYDSMIRAYANWSHKLEVP